MKRTLKAEVQRLEQYLGLPSDPRLQRLLEQLDAAAGVDLESELRDGAASRERRIGEAADTAWAHRSRSS